MRPSRLGRHNAYLDWFSPGPSKHPVFGKVVSGMDVVTKIEKTRRTPLTMDAAWAPRELLSYGTMLGSRVLVRVLFEKGGPEWLLSAGDERFCEKILTVKDGRLAAPPISGTALHRELPDPFLVYLATHEIG